MVGKHLKQILPNAQYLSRNDCDLENWELVVETFGDARPQVVIHLAAKVR
jgi:dTDP-4-dehydrorhamnose reductase